MLNSQTFYCCHGNGKTEGKQSKVSCYHRIKVERTASGLCVPFYPRSQEVRRYVLRGNEAKKSEGMSLEVTSIGFVGTNPESTPLPGVDYFKNQEVYEEKRHKAPIAVEPERERNN